LDTNLQTTGNAADPRNAARSSKSAHAESPVRWESNRASHHIQNGKRSDRLFAVANLRSHASFLSANFSTPFSGSFRTHFVVFSKRDSSAANLSFRSVCVMAFLSHR